MTKRSRTLLFFTLCFLFFTITPSLIFYSLGYAVDFEKKKIVQTGAIFISTEPGEVNVLMSGKQKGKTGIIFKKLFKKNILPKTYTIELKKDGYHSWKKNLEIKEKLTTEIRNIFLFQENPQKQLVLEKKIKEYYPSPDNKKIAYLTSENQINILNFENKNDKLIFSSEKLDKLTKLSWSENSKNIYFKTELKKVFSNYVWQEETETLINLDKIISKNTYNPIGFSWHPKNSDQIYFIDAQKNDVYLNKIILSEEIIVPKIIRNFKNYSFFGDNIYFLEKTSGIIFQTDLDGKSPKKITLETMPEYNVKSGEYTIFIFSQTIAIINEKNDLYILDNQSKLLKKTGENITNASISDDLKKLLFFGPNEVWVLYLDDFLIQPIKYKGDKDLIGRFSLPIENSFWCPDSEHILITSQNNIKITETDGRDIRNTINFLTGSSPYFSKSDKKIYFLNEEKLYYIKF